MYGARVDTCLHVMCGLDTSTCFKKGFFSARTVDCCNNKRKSHCAGIIDF